MTQFWQSFWLIIEIFLFFTYLMILFHIVGDLFRDRTLNGWIKALWVVVLLLFPLLGSLAYLIIRGRGMEQRGRQAAQSAEKDLQEYIRQSAGRNPAHEIAEAKTLLDAGTITEAEFAQIKAKALA
ncbi:SHOCT domain-containing protein [Raineyella sp. W15-4]|uniref:SHOCT domain-containing protein n=1 Tax=Raineyella sp. W15-4 TaxID=3081651 RepID=UPI002955484A|nr:SHOCT domain-containing protein [Raineyella sp. W15-4]WOQ16925.1 SHOCT domain-containing protein [Raineyella sp. W15-4]